MCGLIKVFLLFLWITWVHSDYYTLDLAVSRYKALSYNEIENLEHLYYTFDFCLCSSNFTGLFPNTSPDCKCFLQQRGQKVIQSIPQAVFSASCVHSYTPTKCLNAKFTGVTLGTKIYVKVMIGKSIFTYPSWQTLVYSRYKTISTLKSAAGSDMRITYVSFLRRIAGNIPTSIIAPVTSDPWKRPQPVDSALEMEPSNSFRNDIFDVIRDNFKVVNSWAEKPVKKLQFIRVDDETKWGFTKSQTAAWQPWSVNPFRVMSATPRPTVQTRSWTTPTITSTRLWTMTRPPTITTRPLTTTIRPTTARSFTPKPSILRDPWDLSDVAFIRNVVDVRDFLLSHSIKDVVNPVGYDIETVKNYLVFYHNIYRERHDAPEVHENSYLDTLAQRYSDQLARMGQCLIHEQPRIYGENLFVYGSKNFPDPITFARAVTQSFYMEGYTYSYNSWYPQSYHKTGHFTQLIWRESRQIGIGISVVKIDGRNRLPCYPQSPAYVIYVCVKYDPAGNFETSEAYKRNVLPLKRF